MQFKKVGVNQLELDFVTGKKLCIKARNAAGFDII